MMLGFTRQPVSYSSTSAGELFKGPEVIALRRSCKPSAQPGQHHHLTQLELFMTPNAQKCSQDDRTTQPHLRACSSRTCRLAPEANRAYLWRPWGPQLSLLSPSRFKTQTEYMVSAARFILSRSPFWKLGLSFTVACPRQAFSHLSPVQY